MISHSRAGRLGIVGPTSAESTRTVYARLAHRAEYRFGRGWPKGDIRPRIAPEAWLCFPHAHQPVAISLSLTEPFVPFELFYLPIAAAWGKLAPDQAWVTDKRAPVLTIVPSVATPIVMPLCRSALM